MRRYGQNWTWEVWSNSYVLERKRLSFPESTCTQRFWAMSMLGRMNQNNSHSSQCCSEVGSPESFMVHTMIICKHGWPSKSIGDHKSFLPISIWRNAGFENALCRYYIIHVQVYSTKCYCRVGLAEPAMVCTVMICKHEWGNQRTAGYKKCLLAYFWLRHRWNANYPKASSYDSSACDVLSLNSYHMGYLELWGRIKGSLHSYLWRSLLAGFLLDPRS